MITFNMFGNREIKVKIDECTHVGVCAHTRQKRRKRIQDREHKSYKGDDVLFKI